MDKEEIETAAEEEVPAPVTYEARMKNAIVRLSNGFTFKCCCCNESFDTSEALANHLTSEMHVERIQPYSNVVFDLDEPACEEYFRNNIVISLPNLLKDPKERPRRSFCYRCCDLLTDGITGVTLHLATKRHRHRPITWKNRCRVCGVYMDNVESHEKRAFHRAVMEDNKAYRCKKGAIEVDEEPREDPRVFATSKEYFEFWIPPLDREEVAQQEFLERCEMSEVQVRWKGPVGKECRPRAYFVPRHSDEEDKKTKVSNSRRRQGPRAQSLKKKSDALHFRLRMGDQLQISLNEPIKWVGTGRVVQVPNYETNEACLKLDHGLGVMKDVTKGYTTKPVWNDVSYRRMRSTLRWFSKLDETDSQQKYIIDVLLNRVEPDSHYREPRIQFSWTTENIVSLPIFGSHCATLLDGKQPTPAQLNAVSMGMREQVSIIEGPPGTGKTTVAVLLAYNMLVQKPSLKIMVCAQSNAAVDLLAVELDKAGLKVVRLYSSRYTGCNDDESLARQLGFVRQLFKRNPELSKDYDRFFDKRMQGEERVVYEKKLNFAKEELWDEAQVTCCTCISASSPELRHHRYDVLLIDEASRAIEPECLVPVLASGAPRLVLVGDDKQLKPVVRSLKSVLETSLFERLLQQSNLPRIKLDVQQRLHPLLAQFPLAKFYRGSFTSGVEESQRQMRFEWLRDDKPIIFIDVEESQQHEKYGKSYSNEKEAVQVIELLKDVIESGVVEPKDIGVITPYEGQRRLLRDKIRGMIKEKETKELGWRIAEAEIANVDAFYGRQKKLVVVSFVRSGYYSIGFLNNPERLNTALTRASYKLVLIGNRTTLYDGSYLYAELIEFINQKGLTIRVNEDADQDVDQDISR